MKKFNYFLILAAVLSLALITYVSANNDIFSSKQLGEKTSELHKASRVGENIVSKVSLGIDELEIHDSDVMLYMVNAEFRGEKVSYEEALLRLVLSDSQYLVAKDAGYLVSKDELESVIKETRAFLHESEKDQAFLENYLTGLDMTDDEYWEIATEIIRKSLTIGKYKNEKLKQNLLKEQPELSSKAFSASYNEKIDEMLQEEIDKKVKEGKLKVSNFKK